MTDRPGPGQTVATGPPRRPALTRGAGRGRVSLMVAIGLLLLIAVLAFVQPLLPWYDPYTQGMNNVRIPPFEQPEHPLGTDDIGRDVLSRLSLAIRMSLIVVVAALVLNVMVGVILGLVAGYFGGRLETAVMMLADLQLSFPLMILLVTVVAVVGSSVTSIVIVLGLAYWMGYGRLARAIALSMRRKQFVQAAVTFGAPSWWILRKHLLPTVIAPVVIMAAFDLGVLVVLESSLSYLGLGIRPPTPSLGAMIYEGQKALQTEPWMALIPGGALFCLVAGMQVLSLRVTGESNSEATAVR